MESSPMSECSDLKVDLTTPTENLNKQEVTPDNTAKPDTKPLLAANKVIGIPPKLSKRKLFGLSVDQAPGNENVSETFLKKKRSEDDVKNVSNDGNLSDSSTLKRPLTERQQLAFLLEVTSTQNSPEHENDDSNTFTRIKTRKRVKQNGQSVNARLEKRNEHGETSLHRAAIKGDVTWLKKLIKEGADLGIKDHAGWTALHEACNHGNFEAARLLVKNGADVNVLGFEDDTPLHDAVVNNHVQVVNMLLSNGANPHLINARRKKPIDLISSKEMSDIFSLHDVEHTAFQKTDSPTNDVTSGDVVKSSSDNELCANTSVLENESQLEEIRTPSADNERYVSISSGNDTQLTEIRTPASDNEHAGVENSISSGHETQRKEVPTPSDSELFVKYSILGSEVQSKETLTLSDNERCVKGSVLGKDTQPKETRTPSDNECYVKSSVLGKGTQPKETRTLSDNERRINSSVVDNNTQRKETRTPSENERSLKSSILGNEIQCREAEGEFKMEKPIMYICKLQPRSEKLDQLTLRTTKVTSFKKRSNVTAGGVSKHITGGISEKQVKQQSPKMVAPSSTNAVLSPTARRKITKIILKVKKASSLQVKSCSLQNNDGVTQNKQPVVTSPSEDLKNGTQGEGTSENEVSFGDQEQASSIAKLPESLKDSETAQSQDTEILEKQGDSFGDQVKLDELAKLASPSHSSEEATICSQGAVIAEKEDVLPHDLSEVTEVDRDVKNDSSSTNQSGIEHQRAGSDEKDFLSGVSLRGRSRTPEIDESIALEVLSTGLLSQFHNAGLQQDVALQNTCHHVSDLQLVEDGNVATETVPNDEAFLDVEGLDPDLKENARSREIQKLLPNEVQSLNNAIRQVLPPLEQDDTVSSTANDWLKGSLSKGNVKARHHSEPIVVSLNPVNKRFPIGTESRRTKKHSHADKGEIISSSYGEQFQPDTLGSSQQDSSKLSSETVSLDTAREAAIPPQSSELSICDQGVAQGRSWQAREKKSPDKRRRNQISLRNSSFTKEDKVVVKRKVQQSSANQDCVRPWGINTSSSALDNLQLRELYGLQSSRESRRLCRASVTKPSKPAVTWQSLMAAGRCRLTELKIPGYDQFLMKTKNYELVTDDVHEKKTEESAHTKLTEKERLSLKHEQSREEMRKKQKSEQDKLQLCMEQEIVRFHTKRVYSSLNRDPPPGVCTAIYWQHMSPQQLQNEKKKLSQKQNLGKNQTLPTDHREIIAKYDNLKSLMATRHRHEQQALDAVIKRELQS